MEDLLAIIFKGFFRLIGELFAQILLELGCHKISEDYPKIFMGLMMVFLLAVIAFLIYYFVF